jgi:hypothetical protein
VFENTEDVLLHDTCTEVGACCCEVCSVRCAVCGLGCAVCSVPCVACRMPYMFCVERPACGVPCAVCLCSLPYTTPCRLHYEQVWRSQCDHTTAQRGKAALHVHQYCRQQHTQTTTNPVLHSSFRKPAWHRGLPWVVLRFYSYSSCSPSSVFVLPSTVSGLHVGSPTTHRDGLQSACWPHAAH